MEEIPAVAVITFAVTAFMISAVSATSLYLNDQARADSLDRAKDLCVAVASYGPLLVDGQIDHLSKDALDRVLSGKLKVDLKNSGDMRVNINLRGIGNLTSQSSSWTFGTSNRTDAPDASITRPVLVGHKAMDGQGRIMDDFMPAFLVVWTW